ncbi:spore germination protein [Brevibacillus invocatus]|nr:spore germination protein [Brevibacillus invocatus]
MAKGVDEMPAIVGVVNVNSMTGVFNVGDVRNVTPVSYLQTFTGGGSFNSGKNLYFHIPKTVIYVNDTSDAQIPIFVEEIVEASIKGRERS